MVVPSGLEKSTSSLLESRGYFHLEACQVLRLAYILTFTMLNTQGQGHVSAHLYEGGVVLLARGQWNVLECLQILHQIGSDQQVVHRGLVCQGPEMGVYHTFGTKKQVSRVLSQMCLRLLS
jgi:hypothetical protein